MRNCHAKHTLLHHSNFVTPLVICVSHMTSRRRADPKLETEVFYHPSGMRVLLFILFAEGDVPWMVRRQAFFIQFNLRFIELKLRLKIFCFFNSLSFLNLTSLSLHCSIELRGCEVERAERETNKPLTFRIYHESQRPFYLQVRPVSWMNVSLFFSLFIFWSFGFASFSPFTFLSFSLFLS